MPSGSELDSSNLLEEFEKCAKKLESMAQEYRAMAAFIKSKDIKLLDAEGYSQCGSFTVDEVDRGRLVSSGQVIDCSDLAGGSDALFSIDETLDEALDELDSEEMAKNVMEEIEKQENDSRGIAPNTYQLDSILMRQKEVAEFDDNDGAINLEVTRTEDGHYIFNLSVTDMGSEMPLIAFDREKGEFQYHCGSCDAKHVQTLEAVYRSLRLTCSLMSNFAYMCRHNKEFSMALTAIDDDLRLLTHLVGFDYALEEDDT